MMKELTVDLGERSYPIYIGEELLLQAGDFFEKHELPKASPILIVTDDNVAPHYLNGLTDSLSANGYRVVCEIVASGEKSKSLSILETIVGSALEAGLDRQSTVVALGGGVVGDLAGFVAASYMRGVRFVQVPTTILAHDSSVGGKVAVNHPKAKNTIGAFHQPEMVLYDTATLRSLPERDVKAGFSEVIKHGLIWDRDFFYWCDKHAEDLLALDASALQHALYRGCQIKSYVVSEDEREGGLRAILNLGHTIGHAIEAVANYDELLHGEAISIGMAGAAKLAEKLGYSSEIYVETTRVLRKFGLPTELPKHMDVDRIMKAMMHDKKFTNDYMVFIIPTEIGKVEINKQISSATVKEIVEQLKGEA